MNREIEVSTITTYLNYTVILPGWSP